MQFWQGYDADNRVFWVIVPGKARETYAPALFDVFRARVMALTDEIRTAAVPAESEAALKADLP